MNQQQRIKKILIDHFNDIRNLPKCRWGEDLINNEEVKMKLLEVTKIERKVLSQLFINIDEIRYFYAAKDDNTFLKMKGDEAFMLKISVQDFSHEIQILRHKGKK